MTDVLGTTLSEQAQAEPAWPAVQAALLRARRAGHDPVTILRSVALGRELRSARNISQTLAWRIGRYLLHYPVPVPAATGISSQRDPDIWRTLAWTLKAAEDNGTPAETIITAQIRLLTDLTPAAQHAAKPPLQREDDTLPWLRRPHPDARDVNDHVLARYLDEAARLIQARTRHLAEEAERSLPEWMHLLGGPPADEPRRTRWLHHVGIVAAYRDQHQITSDDPHQVLGPYPASGQAGHTAYWHAAQSVLTTRILTRLEPAPTHRHDPLTAQVAADIYLSLLDPERAAVRMIMNERIGPLQFGPDEPDDDAVTKPAVACYLVQALTERGQMTAPRPTFAKARPVEADLARRGTKQPVGRRRTPSEQPHDYGQPQVTVSNAPDRDTPLPIPGHSQVYR